MATCPSCREHFADDVTTCTKDGSTLVPDAVVAAADTELRGGEPVGEYRIEGKIGEGGFGAVYRAVHPVIGKTAAVKLLHRQFSSNPQMVSRFIAEAKAVNQIRHKNIIDIFSFGAMPDGRQYYVMELLEGMTFDRYIKQRGRLPIEEALPILRAIGRALDAAHAAGIVHRDLKPENIFVQFDEDGVATPKLLDFGIAKLLGDSEQHHKTRTGTPMGTPYYMSPEQAFGRAIDHRSDIYSFGVMTHEALTGRVVFDGESVMDVLFKHVNLPPPRMSERCPELPLSLDEPVLRMLAKDPASRPSNVMEALDDLARAANDAGFNVPAPMRSGGIPPARASDRGVVVGGSSAASISGNVVVTPAGSGAGPLAQAQTVLGNSPTLTGAAADIAPRNSRRWMVIGAVALLVGAVSAAAFTIGKPAPPKPIASQVVTALPPVTATVTAPPVATPAVTPSGAPEVGAEATEVEITVQSTPPAVEIFRGDEKLGTSAAPVKIKRGEKVKLRFVAKGFVSKEIEVAPTQSTLLQVQLAKVPAGRSTTGASEVQW